MKRRFTSLLLIISVIVGLLVPFDLTVFAEDPATGSDVYAILYYIDPTKISGGKIQTSQNVELVLQRGGEVDPTRTVVNQQKGGVVKDCIWNDFADRNCGLSPSWHAAGYNYSDSGHISSIYKVTVKDKIAPTYMSGWFYDQRELVEINNIENIDTSNCKQFNSTFNYSWGLHELDLSSWDTSNIESAAGMFSHQGNAAYRGLKKLNISTWTLPKCTNFNTFIYESQIEDLDISSMRSPSCASFTQMFMNNHKLRTVKIGPMSTGGQSEPFFTSLFANCENLESVYSEGEPVYGKVDMSAWTSNNMRRFNNMFLNCAKIREIDFGDNIISSYRAYSNAYNDAFAGCTSLESIKFNFARGGLCVDAGASAFKDCKNLVELDFSGLDTSTYSDKFVSNLSAAGNIYEGCDNLKQVTFNENYPARDKAGVSVPSKETWAKIKDAAGNKLDGKQVLPATQLFLDFQKEYAGTWVAVDKIVLDANGGKPAFQSIDGSRGMEAVYKEPLTASRAGYTFDGWWSEKDGGSKLEDGAELESWTYYAHWIENTYNLVLNGNGGKVPEGFSMEGATVSDDRETITFENISYTQFVDVSSRMFKNEDGSVLASWNIRKNGTGSVKFAGNDSVNKLAVTQDDTATLYAQWHVPAAVVTFDSQGGSKVAPRDYEVNDPFGTLSSPTKPADTASPAGYTFVGWFTEPGGQGKEIVDKDDKDLVREKELNKVTESCTLYAYWMPNCAVHFDPNGGTINGESSIVNVCMYNQSVGMLPTPEKGSAAFDGWFTDPVGGTQIYPETVVTDNSITYYAHWGYRPKFETDGGSFTTYSENDYPSQESAEYTFGALPTVEKYRCEFLGWYADADGNSENGYELRVVEGETVDLSYNSTIKAKWKEDVQYTVTLNADGGVIPGGQTEHKYYKDDTISGLPVPIKNGCEFGGWYDGSTEVIEGETPITSDMTLTAHWIQKDRTVTFDANGGTMYNPAESTISVVSGKTIPTIPGANKKEADGTVQYFFGGWYPNPDGTGEKLTPETVISADTKYYAKWVDPKNIVKIDDTSSEIMANTLYMYSATWGSPSDGNVTNNTGDNLVFHPISNGHISALLRIQFYSYDNNTSTDITLPPGSVQIKIPKYIFKNRAGEPIGTDNINVGLPEEPVTDSDSIHFYYEEVVENGETFYLIKNSVEMTGRHDDFEIFYEADPNQIAGGYIDENGYYHFMGDDTETTDDDQKYYTNQFNVNIIANAQENGTLVKEKSINYNKPLSLDVHTRVNTNVEKIQTDVSMKWKSEWGSEPADSDEYYYVTWNLVSRHSSSTQPFMLEWSEDTVRDGAIVIPPANHPETERTNGTYSTKVVTKHRKDSVYRTENGWLNAHNEAELEVTWKSGYKQRFRAGADAYAYIEDKEATGVAGRSASFTKRIKGSPEEEDDHYIHGGQERVLIDETIPLEYVIDYKEGKRDIPPTWNPITGTYVTPNRTMTIEDGAAGDLVLSQYSKSPHPNESNWNASTDVNLSENDYYFDKLDINVTEYDAILMNKTWSNPFVHEHVSDYSNDGIIVSIRRVGSTEIETLKPIVHTASATVDLPNDTVWFKVSYSSSFYTTDLQVKPTVCIKPTNHIKSFVQDHIEANKDTMFKNKASLSLTEGDSAPVTAVTGEQGKSGWFAAYVLNIGESKLYASKNCASKNKVILDNLNASENLPAVISGWGYNTTGNKKPMRSAVFYDLLPEGYTVDRASVFAIPRSENSGESSTASADRYEQLKNGDNHLPSAYYSVSFSDNWNDCGRTLMTVDVSIPDDMIATGVDVYYMMNTSFANVIANGATPNNLFAYKDTTPGQSVPIERSRTLSEMEAKFRPSLAFADSPQTAFNSCNVNAQTPSIIGSGLSSTVKTEGTTVSNHQIIGRNTDYSYRISYTSDKQYAGENLVLYDLVERQVDRDISEWLGDFKSLNLSGITSVKSQNKKIYCKPVVYYSTAESFSEDDLNIDASDIWTTEMPPKDEITAIAVDCRKDTAGDPFILGQEMQLSFEINMHSPSDTENNLTAYNEAYIRGNHVGALTKVDNVTQTRVTVRYKVPQFVKDAFPSTGTIDHPESVVKNSVLEYVLKLTNPDDEVPMENVTVEDILCDKVRVNNAMTVQVNDDAPVSIEKAAGITYEVSPHTDGTRFSAVIESIAPGETVIITIPVSVIGEVGQTLTNTANILSVNGVPFDSPVPSNPTYHEISENQVKVLKTNSSGKPLAGADLQILDKDKNVVTLDNNITTFTSTTEVLRFNLPPGNYFLREVSAPTDFNSHEDIAFRIDSEGIIYEDNQAVNYVEMRDQPHYKVIFYENNPELDDKNVVFRTYDPNELNDDKSITHFYDIPKWAKDEYVFAGWYHNNTYTKMDTPDNVSLSPSDFENDKYAVANPNGENDPDYHLYAKWIRVGTVDKAADDTNITAGYRGFGLAGVQIRPKNVKVKDPNTGQFVDADMFDPNIRDLIEGYSDSQYNNEVKVTPEGMRFVTSLSERLLSEVNGIGKIDATPAEGKTFGVEYGYAVGTENNINTFVNHYGIIDKTTYNLQYQGENVNGVNTTGETKSPETDYRYITNVDCTSDQGKGVKNNRDGVVDYDHRNFTDYRLYTLVITYDTPDSQNRLGEKLDARAYMRYYDANGKLRVFYNTYKENTYYGGCMCSFNQISAMMLPAASENTEPTESNEP